MKGKRIKKRSTSIITKVMFSTTELDMRMRMKMRSRKFFFICMNGMGRKSTPTSVEMRTPLSDDGGIMSFGVEALFTLQNRVPRDSHLKDCHWFSA